MITSTILGLLIPFIGTSLGAACVLFMKNELSVKTTKMLSGFAAGVMIAASVWSLLIPALEQSQSLGKMQFIPAVAGFMLGMFFLLILDTITPHMHLDNSVEGPKSNFSRQTLMVLQLHYIIYRRAWQSEYFTQAGYQEPPPSRGQQPFHWQSE